MQPADAVVSATPAAAGAAAAAAAAAAPGTAVAATTALLPSDPFVVYELRTPDQRGGAVVPRIRYNPGPSPANYRFARVPPPAAGSTTAVPAVAPHLPKALEYPARWDELSMSSHSTRTSLLSAEYAGGGALGPATTRSYASVRRFDPALAQTDVLYLQTYNNNNKNHFHHQPYYCHHQQQQPQQQQQQQQQHGNQQHSPHSQMAEGLPEPVPVRRPFHLDEAAAAGAAARDGTAERASPRQSRPGREPLSYLSATQNPRVNDARDGVSDLQLHSCHSSAETTSHADDKPALRLGSLLPTGRHPRNQQIQDHSYGYNDKQRHVLPPVLSKLEREEQICDTLIARGCGQPQASDSTHVARRTAAHGPLPLVHADRSAIQSPIPANALEASACDAGRRRRSVLAWICTAAAAAAAPSPNAHRATVGRPSFSSRREHTYPRQHAGDGQRHHQSQIQHSEPIQREQNQQPKRGHREQGRGQAHTPTSAPRQQIHRSNTADLRLNPQPTSGMRSFASRSALVRANEENPRNRIHAGSKSFQQPRASAARSSETQAPCNIVNAQETEHFRAHKVPPGRGLSLPSTVAARAREIENGQASDQQTSDLSATSVNDISKQNDPLPLARHDSSGSRHQQICGLQAIDASTANHESIQSDNFISEGGACFTFSPACSPSGMLSDVTSPSHSLTPSHLDAASGWVGMDKPNKNVSWLKTPLGLSFEHKNDVPFEQVVALNTHVAVESKFHSSVVGSTSPVASFGNDVSKSGDGGSHPTRPKRLNPDAHSDWSDPHATELDVYCQCDCGCIYEMECRRRCGLGSVHSGGTYSLRSGSCGSTAAGSIKASSRRSSGAAPPGPFPGVFASNHTGLDFPPPRARDEYGGQMPLMDFLQDPDYRSGSERGNENAMPKALPRADVAMDTYQRETLQSPPFVDGSDHPKLQAVHNRLVENDQRFDMSKDSKGRRFSALAVPQQHSESEKDRIIAVNARRSLVAEVKPKNSFISSRGPSANGKCLHPSQPRDPAFVHQAHQPKEDKRHRESRPLGMEARLGSKVVPMMARNWSMPGQREEPSNRRPYRRASQTTHSHSFTEGLGRRRTQAPQQTDDGAVHVMSPGMARPVQGGIGSDGAYQDVRDGSLHVEQTRERSSRAPAVRDEDIHQHHSRHSNNHHHHGSGRRKKRTQEPYGTGLVGTIRRLLRI